MAETVPIRIPDERKALQQTGNVYILNGETFVNYKNEVPTGLIDGINATYNSTNPFNGSTLEVYRNGIKQKVIEDFNITNSTTFVFLSAPLAGDIITINYTGL